MYLDIYLCKIPGVAYPGADPAPGQLPGPGLSLTEKGEGGIHPGLGVQPAQHLEYRVEMFLLKLSAQKRE